MAFADLNFRDCYRLLNAFGEAHTRAPEIVPTWDELKPELAKAVVKEGDLLGHLTPIFGEPIRRGFDLVKDVLTEKHDAEYAEDVWARFLKKGD